MVNKLRLKIILTFLIIGIIVITVFGLFYINELKQIQVEQGITEQKINQMPL